MSDLAKSAQEYLSIRRALGFKLDYYGSALASFTAFMQDAAAPFVTNDLALAWANQTTGRPANRSRRLSVVRGFARHLATIDPRTQVPPLGLLAVPRRRVRRVPYLYSPAEIQALLRAAGDLRPLQAATYQTLVGLLAVTGMRVGEAIALDRDDLDHAHSLLVVRDSKGKSREVPLHPSTMAALDCYQHRRDELRPRARGPSLFISTTATRLYAKVVHKIFAGLCRRAGLAARGPKCRPHLHDLRHTYAVCTLTEWSEADADIAALMPRLSTVLGHRDPAATYWYLQATPELLALAAARLSKAVGEMS